MSNKNEIRLGMRSDVEENIRNYYIACKACDYDFIDDIKDIIFDATDGKIKIDNLNLKKYPH
jgi:hypothetical protein